jgi:hypothetical protein
VSFDSGTSCCYCQFIEGLMDVEEIVESIKIGEGNLMRETKTGTLKFEITQLNGKKFIVTLNDVE